MRTEQELTDMIDLVSHDFAKKKDVTMNEKIRKHLEKANEKEGIQIEDLEDNWIYMTLNELGKEVYSEPAGNRRWWKNIFKVVEINGMLIGFRDAVTTGDDSAEDKGWNFDENSICEVERKEEMKVVVTYERKNSPNLDGMIMNGRES